MGSLRAYQSRSAQRSSGELFFLAKDVNIIQKITDVISSPVYKFMKVVLKLMRMSTRKRKSIIAFKTIEIKESALYQG